MPPVEAQRRAAVLRKWLATKPESGTNTVLVAHRPNLQDAAGKEFGDFKEGEMAVFEPVENGKYKLIARILVENWPTWAKAYGTP